MKTKLVTLLVLLSVVSPALAMTGAAAPDERQAELAVEQPHYVDSDVRATDENGTRVYHVEGSEIAIHPTNFNPDNVVAYGVDTDGGTLSYNSEFDRWTLSADEKGTYRAYWVVEDEVEVEDGNETVTETRQYRYTAAVRVNGGLDMVHKPAGTLSEINEKAQKWEEWNATIQPLRDRGILVDMGLADKPTTDQLHQQMITAYLTFNDPLAVMTGNYSSIVTLVALTLGGWLFLLTVIGPLVTALVLVYRKYYTKESVEADEGALSKRIAGFEHEESLRALANKRFNDVWADDHMADAMRDLGDDPLEGMTNWYSTLRSRFAIHNRLQAMGEEGYVAEVNERALADGGDGGGEITDARVVLEDDVDEDADTVELDVDPDDPLLDALDWEQHEIQEFDLVGADFDRGDLETPVETYDVDRLVEMANLDMRKFDDETVAAQYMRDLFADIRQHPLTDEHGTPNTLRYTLEQHLRSAHLLNDRFEMPVQYWVDLFERSLVEFDEGAEAEKTLRDVRDGAHA